MAWHEKLRKGKENLREFLPFCSNIEILLKTLKQIFQLNYENSTFFFRFISGTLNRFEELPVNQNILWTTD